MGGASVLNRTSTPSSMQRRCSSSSSSLRLMAANPWPPTVTVSERKWMSMSDQRAKRRLMYSATTGSAFPMPPNVSSENTTPNPNVSVAALRSQRVMSCEASSCFISAAKYRPPGPPPTIAIFMGMLLLGLTCDSAGQLVIFVFKAVAQVEVFKLSAGVSGQNINEPDVPRILVRSDRRLDEVLDFFPLSLASDGSLAEDDERAHYGAAFRISAAHDGSFHDVRMLVDGCLYLGCTVVVAGGNDHVVRTGLVDEIALLVPDERVPCDVPAIEHV